jgi:hypothetical protein
MKISYYLRSLRAKNPVGMIIWDFMPSFLKREKNQSYEILFCICWLARKMCILSATACVNFASLAWKTDDLPFCISRKTSVGNPDLEFSPPDLSLMIGTVFDSENLFLIILEKKLIISIKISYKANYWFYIQNIAQTNVVKSSLAVDPDPDPKLPVLEDRIWIRINIEWISQHWWKHVLVAWSYRKPLQLTSSILIGLQDLEITEDFRKLLDN